MPISDCEVRDPRIRRTRQLLQGALRTLLQSKSFEEISVQDITEEATVNRATFYDHYCDKFALLDALAAGEFHKLLHDRQVHFDSNCPSAASAIIRATCDYLVQMHEGRSNCAQHSATGALVDAAIIAAIHRVLTRPSNDVGRVHLPEMTATAVSWAIYGAARNWYFTADHLPVEEVVPRILELVFPMLLSGSNRLPMEAASAR